MENYVLSGNVGAQFAVENDLNCLGNLEPCHTCCHTGSHVSAADTGTEGTDGTISAGVAVCADDAVAGSYKSLLREQSMLDAHLADIVEVADAVGTGEITALLALCCGFDVLIGGEMVKDNIDAVFIEYFGKAGFVEFVYSNRGGDIVAEN